MGIRSVSTFIKHAVEGDIKPYLVAYHYKIDPDIVRTWDNEAIARAYYALVKMEVLK